MKGVPKVDNSKNSNADRPFGTFDWTNLSPEQVNKPKDITSDMWTPISAGKVYSQTPPPSRLDDREKGGQKKKTAPRRTGNQTPAKKSPSAAGKKTAAPSKKAPQSQKRKPAGKEGSRAVAHPNARLRLRAEDRRKTKGQGRKLKHSVNKKGLKTTENAMKNQAVSITDSVQPEKPAKRLRKSAQRKSAAASIFTPLLSPE